MKFKRVVFNTWSAAFFQKGGGEVQLLKSKNALEEMGLEILLYNTWEPQKDINLFHQFSIEPGVEQTIKAYKDINIPVAISPIMWNLLEKKTYEYERVEKIFRQADIILTNSNLESRRLSESFEIDLEKFHKTRNSISEAYKQDGNPEYFRKKYNIDGEYVLSVANIDKRKNTHQLVRACHELNIPLILIGHLKDKDYFNTFKSISPSMRYIGPIEDEEVLKSAYSSCTVFALPSKCETPGIAALEAAAQGAKILITSEGSTREYFEDFVTYVNPWSIDSIKDGLRKSLSSKTSDDLKFLIRDNFTWKKTARDIHEGYDKILNNNSSVV